LDGKIEAVKAQIDNENAKFRQYASENVRRRHDYVPLIFNLLRTLAERGKLRELCDKAEKTSRERVQKRADAKAKDAKAAKDAKSKTAGSAAKSPEPKKTG